MNGWFNLIKWDMNERTNCNRIILTMALMLNTMIIIINYIPLITNTFCSHYFIDKTHREKQFVFWIDDFMLENLWGFSTVAKPFSKNYLTFENRYYSIYNNVRMGNSIIVHAIHNTEFENWLPVILKAY